MRISHLFTALGLNSVPALGWFVGDWSVGTTLLLYWTETLLGSFLVALRIVLHRRLVPSKGHWDYKAPQGQASHSNNARSTSTYLAAFLVPALVFTCAHGIFLAALGGMMIAKQRDSEVAVEGEHLLVGLTGIATFQCFDFLLDLFRLRERPFRWIEQMGQHTFSRVVVVHLTIIGGMGAVMITGANRDFFGVFIFLKTLLNCSLYLPQWRPETPPAWLSKLMDRIKPTEHKNTTFAEFWRHEDEQEAARVARNETSSDRARR